MYLALADSSAYFLQGCRFLKYSRIIRQGSKDRFHLQDYHLLWFLFPENSVNEVFVCRLPLQNGGILPLWPPPRAKHREGLGSSRFARRYLGNIIASHLCPQVRAKVKYDSCFLFLRLLRCFTSAGSLLRHSTELSRLYSGRVSPFGHPRIKAC